MLFQIIATCVWPYSTCFHILLIIKGLVSYLDISTVSTSMSALLFHNNIKANPTSKPISNFLSLFLPIQLYAWIKINYFGKSDSSQVSLISSTSTSRSLVAGALCASSDYRFRLFEDCKSQNDLRHFFVKHYVITFSRWIQDGRLLGSVFGNNFIDFVHIFFIFSMKLNSFPISQTL